MAKRQKIAVIDNDLSMLVALERLLDAHGFDVTSFPSAEAFEGDVGTAEVECLVLDIHLDGMSGLELAQKIVAAGRPLPVIFITAFDTPESQERARRLGCAALLLKPFTSRDLIDAIHQATA